ncbi:MAG: hypothetical protein COT90_02325 [Candidatus Diapherotrites archaeon CG10_big_fil_rev_8_21_14_0_10_31_34]|nr:MAG: hypothetical protein COT90_02325 [Candidatus Diapherotrites archaeon CG10_big_fil_rev_8_21_14_0_10_31_34]PJA19662.1 MAG: hypothetical protein COX63_01380 [Candidatus Diapherotrites archaeon CG_4_10_14_0_2_um_filter_31_5]
MNKTTIILALILFIGIVFSGCLQPKPIPSPEQKNKEIIPENKSTDLLDNQTEKEIDDLFDQEINNLPEEDLTGLEEELI